jgi:hypothetical protein
MLFLTRARTYAIHLVTASGVVAAFLAVVELLDATPDERVAAAWLALLLGMLLVYQQVPAWVVGYRSYILRSTPCCRS